MKHLITIVLLLSVGSFSRKNFQRQRFYQADSGLFSNAVNAINVNIGNMRCADALQESGSPPPKCFIENLWKKLRKRNMENAIQNAEGKTTTVRISRVGTNESCPN